MSGEIWSKRLYRKDYRSFKEYCEKKWKFTRGYGYRLIRDAETIKKVSTIVNTSDLITNGNQAAAMAEIPDEKVGEVVVMAKKKAGTNKITGRHIKEAAREVLPQSDDETEAPAIEVDSGEAEKVISLTQQWAHVGFASFDQMHALITEIHKKWEDPEQHTHVGNRIVST